ncbi:DUF4269 domain-containing protein [Mucilaginibacter agri]|uniref:DUF4269 domain-containing protein n=1 Tax=Mucilaginibacter agri TaxID=2695265 RepID=A0A965ZI37_9SPHI|nr:DUF4269 domain-containing protein [Mucilaginibacter agri]NCD70127.1 DUF4269 domain-containing protein [Mucilaginibacter agri]
MEKFDATAYLEDGNNRQQHAYKLLTGHAVFEILQPYSPLLTGTIPIEIDVDGSDLDIICCWSNADEFYNLLVNHFSSYPGFSIKRVIIQNKETIIANFHIEGVEIEIFGQNIPVKQQEAYRHMIVEYWLLNDNGELFRQKIIKLKQQGMKTEPAFAKILGLEGNAYDALLSQYETYER